MKTNWALATLGTAGVLGIGIGLVMIMTGRGADYPLYTSDAGLIWAGGGVLALGIMAGVAALVVAALTWQMRESAQMLADWIAPVRTTADAGH